MDRVLLVATYWRTNVTMRQIGPLLGVLHSAAHRVIDTLGPLLPLAPVRKHRSDQVNIVDGTLAAPSRTRPCPPAPRPRPKAKPSAGSPRKTSSTMTTQPYFAGGARLDRGRC